MALSPCEPHAARRGALPAALRDLRRRARAVGSALRPRALGDHEALWVYLAFEWAAGATLLTLILQTTEAPRADRLGLYGVCALAYVFVAVMVVARSRLPASLVQPAVLLGHVLISLVVYFSGDPATFFSMYYVWLNVYVFYFFGLRPGWVHTVVALAGYAAVLLVLAGTVPLTPLLMTAGTLVVVGSMVGSLHGRVERLVAQLADAARRDELTGLLNRRGFGEAMTMEIARSRRSGRPFSLLIADIDHFKLVNDRAGHSAGDTALRRAGVLLSTNKREIDSAARLGGEEFAIVLADADAAAALVVAERLRARVEEHFAGDRQPITMSLGVASFPHDAANAEDLQRAADSAMYAAKHHGRNRCERYRANDAVAPLQASA